MNESIKDTTLQKKDNNRQAAADVAESKGKVLSDNRPLIQKKANNTGLPDHLKSGIENLSGHAMDDVKVHYNSDKPAQLNAHAYAQGTDIHIASGQEKHLPHEAWHVVQQKQGRVKPTMQMKGKVNVNDDTGLEKEADIMGEKAMQLDSKTTQYYKFNYNSIKPNSTNVTQCQREYGLNTEEHIGEFTDSLFENFSGDDNIHPMIKVSQMMTSINARLKNLKYPEIEIVSKKGLENRNSANFDFKTWKIQIDQSLLVINADLANLLYHEARHSEQWFKMILMRIKKNESKEKIITEMNVPRSIVNYAFTLNTQEVLPEEQHESISEFHQSIYGSGRDHRFQVLTNLEKNGNYEKYKNLPEEVDAWEVGGKINIAIQKKEDDLIKKIKKSDDLEVIREAMSKLQFYTKMLLGNDNKAKLVLIEKLKKWEEEIEILRSYHSDKTGENLTKYISISANYNKLCTMVGLKKILEVNPEKVMNDFNIMDENLNLAKQKLKLHEHIWAVNKLVEYIEMAMAQYNSEVIKPEPNSAQWAVGATGKFVTDIDQAIKEETQEHDKD